MSQWRKLDTIEESLAGTLSVSDPVSQALLTSIDGDTSTLVTDSATLISQGVVANGLLGTSDTAAQTTASNTTILVTDTATLVSQGTAANALLTTIDTATGGTNTNTTTLVANTTRSDGLGVTLRKEGSYGLTAVRLTGSKDSVSSAYQSISKAFLGANSVFVRTSNSRFIVASTSANDTNSAGSGARQVILTGVDASFAVIGPETVLLNGTTDVATTFSGISITECKVSVAGSSGGNEGKISVVVLADGTTAGVPDAPARVYAQMPIPRGICDTPLLVIPAGKSFYATSLTVSSDVDSFVQLRFQDLSDLLLPVNQTLVEVFCPATSFTVDLHSLPAITGGAIHVLGRNVITSATISFTLTGFIDT